jgi:hypothetical protein
VDDNELLLDFRSQKQVWRILPYILESVSHPNLICTQFLLDVYSNFLCTVVMEEGIQKSKRLLYMAKFKCEVVQCTEEKVNRSHCNFWSWWKQQLTVRNTRQQSVSVRHHKRNSLDPRKNNFLKVFTFLQERCKTGKIVLYYSYNMYNGSIIFPKSSPRPKIWFTLDFLAL